MITDMDTTIQTGIRISRTLYDRLKRNAKREKRSLNNYITGILESATAPAIPRLVRSEYEPDDELRELGRVIGDIPAEKIERDPRLKSILGQ
jgi:hypothetical protein